MNADVRPGLPAIKTTSVKFIQPHIMATFKVPQSLPQDLLLISEFVDVPEKQQRQKHASNGDDDDDIASSGSDSEEEIEKDLTALPDKDEDESDGISLYASLRVLNHLRFTD